MTTALTSAADDRPGPQGITGQRSAPNSWVGSSRGELRWLLLSLLIYGLLVVRIVATRHYWPRYDSGAYISAAVAVSRGIGLRDITAPVGKPEQVWGGIPTWVSKSPEAMAHPDWPIFVQYPPLLPLLLAPLVSLGHGHFLALQALPMLCGALALVALYRWRHQLMPGPWKATLLLTAGSMATLYGTRVQSEAVLLPLVIVALWLLWRANARPERLMLYALLTGLVLLAAGAVHSKVIFVCAGAALWLLLRPKAPLLVRAFSAGMVVVLTIVPIMFWMNHATWAGRPSGRARLHPYLRQDGWNPTGPSVLSPSGVLTMAKRAAKAGTLCLESTGAFLPVKFSRFSRKIIKHGLQSLVFYVLIVCGWRSWRTVANGAVAWCASLYLIGVFLSPWPEERMAIPVVPFMIHALALGLMGIAGHFGDASTGPHQRVTGVALMAAFGLQLWYWASLTPGRDEYARAYHHRLATQAKLAGRLPEDRVALILDDNYSFALVSGRAAISLLPAEWKESNARRFLAAGGAATAIRPYPGGGEKPAFFPLPKPLASWGERFETRLLRVEGMDLLVGWIGAPVDPVQTLRRGQHEPPPTRIHPRWLNMTRGDADAIWRAAFPLKPHSRRHDAERTGRREGE